MTGAELKAVTTPCNFLIVNKFYGKTITFSFQILNFYPSRRNIFYIICSNKWERMLYLKN